MPRRDTLARRLRCPAVLRRFTLRSVSVLALAALLTLSACGDDESTASRNNAPADDSSNAPSGQSFDTATTTVPAALAEIEARGKPTVTVPDQPATELKIIDDVVGTGTEVKPGDSVTVHYVGVGQQSKQEFDSSWKRDETISFPLSGVIKGWTDGLVGMKVGGRRTLIIPGDLAYGPAGRQPAIGPNETLVFTIDLVGVN